MVLVLPLVLLAAGCNVSKDGNAITVQYDQNTAENAVADVSNTAGNVAADIGNDVQATGDKIENKVGDRDVDVNVNADVQTNNQ
jgi:hypothetical protein